jgi:hypothetical protein
LDKIFQNLAERFTNFFTRSVAPSSIFFVLLFFNDKFYNCSNIYNEFIKYITQIKDINQIFLYVVLTIIFLAYGYTNQIFSQILDNLIKKNYEFDLSSKSHKQYKSLREKVKEKLSTSEKEIFEVMDFHDYNAYQVLGKVLNNNTSYVDDIKNIHTLFIAISLNTILLFTYFHNEFFPLLIIVIPFFLSVEHYFVRSRYMARNKRMYINYLLIKDKKKNEKEIKIKSIKVEVDE